MQVDYYLMDVFTDTPLAGNPLAVVAKADHLRDGQMQRIARELNLSETVFLCAPESAGHTASVRIFTPGSELPFAGHPTIGAAVMLGLRQRVNAVRLEEKIGLVTCIIDRINKKTGFARFNLPRLPVETGPAPANSEIASTLGLKEEEIGHGAFQPQRFSAGLEYTIVPVRDEQALERIVLERRGWRDTYGQNQASVYVFVPTPEIKDVDFEARMFEPDLSGGEDPGTGSAVAALIGYLAKYGEVFEGQRGFTVRQGRQMKRPCRIEMQFGFSGGELVRGSIGGKAIIVGQGQLDVERTVPGRGLRPL